MNPRLRRLNPRFDSVAGRHGFPLKSAGTVEGSVRTRAVLERSGYHASVTLEVAVNVDFSVFSLCAKVAGNVDFFVLSESGSNS